MRGFVGWINYRDAVVANLNALLVMYPGGRQFHRDFPDLKAVMRGHFDSGVSAPSSALQIAERIIGDFIGQLGDAEKTGVSDALIATGRAGFAATAESRVKGARDHRRDNVRFVAELAGVALFMAGRMAADGTIGRGDHEWLLDKLLERIDGEEVEVRRALRASLTP